MTMKTLPPEFIERLEKIIPKECFNDVLETFSRPNPVSIRVNVLKSKKENVMFFLRKQNIHYLDVTWYHDALILDTAAKREITETALVKNGFIFIQSLSSMLAPLILNPKPGEHVLDMCAAPGGKATQMAAMMQNQGSILALECVRPRFYKLKSVISLLDARNIHPKLADARRFSRGVNLFDRILLDVPCSSEGRFKTNEEKTSQYWSFRKIKEMARKQKELALAASRFLKPGGVMVYSTCTFAPEENEAIIDWLLKKTDNRLRVIKPDNFPIRTYPAVTHWNNKDFNPQVADCLRVLPDQAMEGFFIAKLMRV